MKETLKLSTHKLHEFSHNVFELLMFSSTFPPFYVHNVAIVLRFAANDILSSYLINKLLFYYFIPFSFELLFFMFSSLLRKDKQEFRAKNEVIIKRILQECYQKTSLVPSKAFFLSYLLSHFLSIFFLSRKLLVPQSHEKKGGEKIAWKLRKFSCFAFSCFAWRRNSGSTSISINFSIF